MSLYAKCAWCHTFLIYENDEHVFHLRFYFSEKDDEDGEKREEPRDNSEEPGGGMDKLSGPWNRSAPTQTPVAEIIGELLVFSLFILKVY